MRGGIAKRKDVCCLSVAHTEEKEHALCNLWSTLLVGCTSIVLLFPAVCQSLMQRDITAMFFVGGIGRGRVQHYKRATDALTPATTITLLSTAE